MQMKTIERKQMKVLTALKTNGNGQDKWKSLKQSRKPLLKKFKTKQKAAIEKV